MPLTVYATSSDLATWTGTAAPTNAATLLRSATFTVAAACARDPYNDTPSGNDATALRDATTAQAAAWLANGIDPAAAGLDAFPVKTKKIGTASVERDTTGQVEARNAAATTLAPEAEKILYTAGLLALPLPVTADPTDRLANYGLSRTGSPWSVERMNAIDGFSLG